MLFNDHSDIKRLGLHAFLSASSPHWLRYDDERLLYKVDSSQAAVEGTKKHNLAAMMIEMKVKAQRGRQAFNSYVNDAIGFGMDPEVVLFVHPECFGTADAIKFDEKEYYLRIHDLKTGRLPTKMDQLRVYAAMFCMEYGYEPFELTMELRIYQGNDGPITEFADPAAIKKIMNHITHCIKVVTARREELS